MQNSKLIRKRRSYRSNVAPRLVRRTLRQPNGCIKNEDEHTLLFSFADIHLLEVSVQAIESREQEAQKTLQHHRFLLHLKPGNEQRKVGQLSHVGIENRCARRKYSHCSSNIYVCTLPQPESRCNSGTPRIGIAGLFRVLGHHRC